MRASVESDGRSLSQHSQLGRISSMDFPRDRNALGFNFHFHILRRIDSDPYLIAVHRQHRRDILLSHCGLVIENACHGYAGNSKTL
jgi:hypothetical protein